MNDESPTIEPSPAPRWRPLEGIERRVLGVLIEKAKTTPESYPLSLNALRSGCNQKNNRSPLMQLEESTIEEALDALREAGAAAVVQGGGRIDRYRHLAYEWLGVDKVELAVMAELLLRGSQTVGELRGRAARMEPIKGLSELQPTLDSLQAKGLIQYLTPPGRGSIVTHTLYLDREMDKVRREAAASEPSPSGRGQGEGALLCGDSTSPLNMKESSDNLHHQVTSLRDELSAVKRELDAARAEFTTTTDELRRDLDRLLQQLGN
jgi:uncharacterized protein YceH (UPF0502 family)